MKIHNNNLISNEVNIMGLNKEPQNVDFYVMDKAWSETELKEFSELIKQNKTQQKKKKIQPLKTVDKLLSGVTEENLQKEIDFGKPNGKEL